MVTKVTHEPKLARAKRLIPEWTVYVRFPHLSFPSSIPLTQDSQDDEVAALAARIAASSQSTSAVEQGGINAFSKRADELVQAVEQSAERDEFVHEKEVKAEESGERKKDEL